MKIYLVRDFGYENMYMFSTLDKAKECCYNLAEQEWEQNTSSFEENPFDKDDVTFVNGKDCIYVDYQYRDLAIITTHELDNN